MPIFPAFPGPLKKHWAVPVFFLVVVASDVGSRALDRFRSPCARHDTRGALSRTLIDTRAGFDLAVAAVAERGRSGERVTCSATFTFIRPATRAWISVPEVTYSVMDAEGSRGRVDITPEAWKRIAAVP